TIPLCRLVLSIAMLVEARKDKELRAFEYGSSFSIGKPDRRTILEYHCYQHSQQQFFVSSR
ncbi:147_t:CDS:2, partial [Gigaspora margarita]